MSSHAEPDDLTLSHRGRIWSIFTTKVLPEMERAEQKHPRWPRDLAHQMLIVNEEAGEVSQACLNLIEYLGKDFALSIQRDPKRLELELEIDKEMTQVAAMALRFLVHREVSRAESGL